MTTKDTKKKRETKSKEAKREETLASLQNNFLHKPALEIPGKTVVTISPAILKGREGEGVRSEKQAVTPGHPLFTEKSGQALVSEKARQVSLVEQLAFDKAAQAHLKTQGEQASQEPTLIKKEEEPARILTLPEGSLIPSGTKLSNRVEPAQEKSPEPMRKPESQEPTISSSEPSARPKPEPDEKAKPSSSLFAFLDLGASKESKSTQVEQTVTEKLEDKPPSEEAVSSESKEGESNKPEAEATPQEEQGVFKKAYSFLTTLTKKNKNSSED